MSEQVYAFPGEYSTHLTCAADGSAQPALVQHPGMTLRDYFAGQAIQAAMQRGFVIKDDPKITESFNLSTSVAQAAYELADAMLAARAALSSHTEQEGGTKP